MALLFLIVYRDDKTKEVSLDGGEAGGGRCLSVSQCQGDRSLMICENVADMGEAGNLDVILDSVAKHGAMLISPA